MKLVQMTACLICSNNSSENKILLPKVESEKLLNHFGTYLNTSIPIPMERFQNESHWSFCNCCYDSAIQLNTLDIQLTKLQNEISELSSTLSQEIFLRQNQFSVTRQLNNAHPSTSMQPYMELSPENRSTKRLRNISKLRKCNYESLDCPVNSENEKDFTDNMINVNHPEEKEMCIDNVKVEFVHGLLPEQTEIVNDSQFNTSTVLDEDEYASVSMNAPEGTEVDPLEMVETTVTDAVEPLRTATRKSARYTTSDLLQSVKMPTIKLKRTTFSMTSQQKRKVPENHSQKQLKNLHRGKEQQVSLFYENVDEDSQDLKKYKVKKSSAKFFKCSFCEKSYRSKQLLKHHERIHTGERPYKCSFCEKSFRHQCARRVHEVLHTGEGRHKCSFCQKPFLVLFALKEHERTHTGEKPFNCSICGRAFNMKRNMKAHEKLHFKKQS